MRLRERMSFRNWRYALGELALIIAGILIALALNDWNADRHRRQAELSMLREIRAAVAADLVVLRAATDALQLSEHRTSLLRDLLRSDAPVGGDMEDMDVLFGSAYGFRVSHVNTAPYEALKARGLDLIRSDSVRVAIIRVFESGAAEIRRADEVSTNIAFDVLRPYYLERFRDIQFLERATPLDREAVLRDPYFENLLDYRLTVLRRSVLPRYAGVIEEMSALVAALDRELAHR